MNDVKNPSAGLGLGITGLVLGILSVPFGILGCTFTLALIMGILGITLSAVGYSQAKQANAPTGLILAAMIISIMGTSFALIRLTHSAAKSEDIFEGLKLKLEKLEDQHSDEIENSFENAFEEGFKEEFDEEFDEDLEDLEDVLDQLERDLEDAGDEIEGAFEKLSDEEKAKKLGRATGKALRGFVNELKDTVDNE